MTTKEKLKDVLAILAMVFLLLFSCYALVTISADPQQQASSLQTQQEVSKIIQDYQIPFIALALILFLAWLANLISKSRIAIPLLFITFGVAAFVMAGYFLFYGDKNNDGIGDSQIVKFVQPTGSDASVDEQYSKINARNAKTNLVSVASFMLIIAVLLVLLVVLTGLGMVLHYARKKAEE
jgi:hypothetical protein